jgi:hypothetical protein
MYVYYCRTYENMYVYYCRTYEKAVSGGPGEKNFEAVTHDSDDDDAVYCSFQKQTPNNWGLRDPSGGTESPFSKFASHVC